MSYSVFNLSANYHKQKQISGFSTKSEAVKALHEIEYKISQGVFINNDIKIHDFFEIWFRDHVNNLKPKTQQYYKGIFERQIQPNFPNIKLNDIKINNIKAFYSKIQGTISEDRLFKTHKTLQACLRCAYHWEYIDRDIMDRVTVKQPERPERVTWTPDEIKIALDKFKGSEIEYHVYLACYLGLREGETCALTFNDFDKTNKTLRVNKTLQIINGKIIIGEPKTKKSKRLIPLQDNVFKFLCDEQRKIKEHQVFLGNMFDKTYQKHFSVFDNGNIKTDNYVCKKFNKEVKRLSLKKITFHDIRHSCASWLLTEGVDLKIIQEILGHSNFSITADTYAHVDLDQKRKALNILV